MVSVDTASTGTSLCLPLVPIGSFGRGYDLVTAPPPPNVQLNCNDWFAILTVERANETLFEPAVTYVWASVLVDGKVFKTWTVNVFVVQSSANIHFPLM